MPMRPCQFYRRRRTPSPAALTFMEILRVADAEMATMEQKAIERPAKKKRRR